MTIAEAISRRTKTRWILESDGGKYGYGHSLILGFGIGTFVLNTGILACQILGL